MKKETNSFLLFSKFRIAVSILLIAVAPLLISVFLQGKKIWVQFEMKEALEQSKLHTITAAPNTFTWVDGHNEILINHQLFDVKDWSIKNNQYIFLGLFDKEETQIENLIINSQENQSSENNKNIKSLAFHIPTGSGPTELDYSLFRIGSKIQYSQISSPIVAAYYLLDSPPPRA